MNPIQAENARAGTAEWQLSHPSFDPQNPRAQRAIEGYASLTSVQTGDVIKLYVNTVPASEYTLRIFRLGWYGGLGGREVLTPPIIKIGRTQPIPQPEPITGLVECEWEDPVVLTVPQDWTTGIYLAQLTHSGNNRQGYITFVVRSDAPPADGNRPVHLFQSSVSTFQAYNEWGGRSLYYPEDNRATHVSFNRPYGWYPMKEYFSHQAIPSPAYGAGDLFFWEINMLRWLEREGYNISYCTSIDTHNNLALLLSHRVLLSIGHDEYWSHEMRRNVEQVRDQGVNVCFFSANTCYWRIRFENSRVTGGESRTLVCYKGDWNRDPAWTNGASLTDQIVASNWAGEPDAGWNPPDTLTGLVYNGGHPDDDIVLNVSDPGNWPEENPHWVVSGTGLRRGDRLPGLLGYECDGDGNRKPGNWIDWNLLSHSPFTADNQVNTHSDMIMYSVFDHGRRRGTVFSAGTVQWSWGLDDYNAGAGALDNFRTSRIFNGNAQLITKNVLDKLGQELI